MHASDIDILPNLWEKLPKHPDAEHITYTQDDIDLLWHMGFIDAGRYHLEEWRKIALAWQGKHGLYQLSRADFLGIDQYRYRGVLYAPLDPADINEGYYTDEGLQELIDQSIAPECGLQAVELLAAVDAVKQKIRGANGLLRVDRQVKHIVAGWLRESPSPLRRLELMLAASFAEQGIDIKSLTADLPDSGLPASPAKVATLQSSTFALLSTSPMTERIQALRKLEKAHILPPPTEPPAGGGTPLKTLSRSRRGVRS